MGRKAYYARRSILRPCFADAVPAQHAQPWRRPGPPCAYWHERSVEYGARRSRAPQSVGRSTAKVISTVPPSRLAIVLHTCGWCVNCSEFCELIMPNKSAVLVAETSKEKAGDNPLVQILQRQVANAFVLHSNYKHYHWQTFGPLFRDLHLMFDEFAEAVLGTIDEFAERIRMIGPDPIYSQQQVLETASVEVARQGKR